ncbi:hypothetical protein Lal_00047747 [Lupinus albus]|nr:hypothetical protein Lal_00047747 [Lupinus albus]
MEGGTILDFSPTFVFTILNISDRNTLSYIRVRLHGNYKVAKKETNKAVSEKKDKIYYELYKSQNTKGRERIV